MTQPSDFEQWMLNTQQQMENHLGQLLPPPTDRPQYLHEAMRYATLDGGKRVRPMLAFAAGELFNAPETVLYRAAAAVEMIHAYSLVHDDLPCMDNDSLRRGKPTVHVRFDEATALLAGDALQAQAFQVLSDISDCAPVQVLAMIRTLATASGALGMCGGQAIDLESVGKVLTRDQLEQMHRLKTGALLRASVMMGALAGKMLNAQETEALDAYASAVGLAFQVVDDILDATADSATLGKTAGKDASDNKPTYVSLLGLEASSALAEALRQKAHASLASLGHKASRLCQLADLIVYRKN